MRIQHLIHTPRYSGAEILVASLTLAHRKLGHESNVVSFAPSEADFENVILEQEKSGTGWVTPNKLLKGIERIVYYRQAQNQFKPDITFAHSVIPAAYARLGLLKNVIPVLHAENNYSGGGISAAEHLLQHLSKGVIHISSLAGTLYTEKYRKPLTQCIPNGIDIELIRKSSKTRDITRKHFGFSESTTVLIQAGRVCRIKGQLLSLKATAPLLKSNLDIQILFAGLFEDLEYQKELQSFIKAENIEHRVHFLGPRNDIPSLLYASDVFLMPSKREAQGIALVEALATGLPIVASDITGFQFSRDFEGVKLVNTESLLDYTNAVNSLISPRQRHSRNLSGYDIQDTAVAYIEFAKKCIY
ncbi:glycosyltransferase family 4 protein [Pseudomonas psychrophila]|uniref:glycosyltransferase family 4 protein n=1 Tax=Pseudomonas psychrophila TaxID=122355 RepID=UPI0003155154|nr:glycosyltransferase family 4 protein [Pseudomonas psychrophila]